MRFTIKWPFNIWYHVLPKQRINPEIRPEAEDPVSDPGGHRLCTRCLPSREQGLCPAPGVTLTRDCTWRAVCTGDFEV